VEHRWGERKAVHKSVRVRTRAGSAAQGYITNVSISGAFLSTPLPVALFSVIEVSYIGVRGGRRASAVIEAQVVRKTPGGLGLEWCEFAPAVGRPRNETATKFDSDRIAGIAPGSERAK
jgi:hypothetical protein